jgi:hypothetical protein
MLPSKSNKETETQEKKWVVHCTHQIYPESAAGTCGKYQSWISSSL